MSLRHYIQHSSDPMARLGRAVYKGIFHFSMPAPRIIWVPVLRLYLLARSVAFFARRVFWAEPLFKAYCASVGRDVHTGIYLHWVQGSGVITVGDRTTVDGKCSFAFSSAHRPDPTLAIGSNVWIGHGCGFTVADRIDIGDHVMIAGECSFLDSSGHPTDPDLRRAKQPAPRDRVRPIVIERDAWIGQRSILLPGTTVGEGAVVAAHSVVRGRVEPFTIVAGNPAQVVGRVKRTDS